MKNWSVSKLVLESADATISPLICRQATAVNQRLIVQVHGQRQDKRRSGTATSIGGSDGNPATSHATSLVSIKEGGAADIATGL
jgi:hypothetical protein